MLEYQSPEQLLCRNYAKPIDIWAAGVILYKMAFGFKTFPYMTDRPLPPSVVQRCILENELKLEICVFDQNTMSLSLQQGLKPF